MFDWNHNMMAEVDIVLGCCMLLPRRAIGRVGMFDPEFFVYSEEHDLCHRLRDEGLKVVFVPEARMIHFGGQTSKRMSLKMALVQIRSRIRYFYKHHGSVSGRMFRLLLALGCVVRLAGWAAIYPFSTKRSEKITPRLAEYWQSLVLAVKWSH